MGNKDRVDTQEFALLTRRSILKLGLVSTGSLVVAGAGGLLGIRGCAPPVAGLRVLNRHHYRTLAMIADTLIPRGGAFPLGASDFDLARTFDGYLADEPPENISRFRRALHLVEYGPLIFEHRLATFSNLDVADRSSHWQSWEISDLLLRRQVALAFRRFVYMMFYDQVQVWPHIGYPGPALTTT